jgi:hypothetical protein
VSPDPRELVMLDPFAWAAFWRILENAPVMADADIEAYQRDAARLALQISAARWN